MLLEIIINSSFMAYKGIVIIRHSNEIWNVLDLTRVDFMKYRCHDRISDVTYNAYFRVFQFLETFYGLCAIHFSIVFDTLLIAICYSLSSQLETLKSTYSSLGHTPKRVLYDDDIECKDVNRVKPVTSDDIQMIISDHQAIIKKMEQFYKIVRSVILSQLVVSSNTQIFMSYIIALNFMNSIGLRSVETIKMLCATPIFSIQLYLTCLLFGNINKQKNEINFALYSSDWTNMDSKCRKLILFALRMNNANRLTMRVTETKIVNLEMFKNVLHMSYSVFSVLVNSNAP
ncbi:odorant receptor 94a-like [Adelges cooleyi]|uniref:odorant receptor 94a-like n=1 Tax=Adelges cooleyi TaxID=133065 RepID=UPI00217F4314|nr:odorant receptor 94a-like [Adelges cooleyi]